MRGHKLNNIINKYNEKKSLPSLQKTLLDIKPNQIKKLLSKIPHSYNLNLKEYPIDKQIPISNLTITKLQKYLNSNNTIILITKEDLLIKGHQTIYIPINNFQNFNIIFLPEILKLYSNFNNQIFKEEIFNDKTSFFCNINDNLYILDYEEYQLNNSLNFLKQLYNRKNANLAQNQNTSYLPNNTYEDNKTEYQSSPQYSYGYINILLISLIISIITILICIIKY